MNSRLIVLLAASLLGAAATPVFALGESHAPNLSALPGSQSLNLQQLAPNPAQSPVIRIAQTGEAAAPFTWSATKSDGTISLAGNTPNAAIKSFLSVRAGSDTEDRMSVVGSGPDGFVDNSLAGLAALTALDEGRASYSGSKWTLSGYAASEEVLNSVLAALESAVDLSDWVVFVEIAAPDPAEPQPSAPEEPAAEAEPPAKASSETEPETAAKQEPAEPEQPEMAPDLLNWSVSRNAEGVLTLGGMVHTTGLQSYLRVRAGEGAIDNSAVGGTPPPDFINSALAALDAVKSLETGRAAYTGTKWTLAGFTENRETLDAMLASLASAVDVSDWAIFVQVSPQPEAPAEPEQAEIEPVPAEPAAPESTAVPEPGFQFNALKADGGEIALSGNVPSAAFANYASVIAGLEEPLALTTGGDSGGGISLNDGAPEGFIDNAIVALRALKTLESGLLAYENDQWSLIGDALSDEDAAAVSADITGLPEGDQWVLDLAVVPVFQLCANVVAGFSDTHTILFAPASAILTAESAAALADLVTELKKCPAADLHIEGHTDADGPEDSNMALSVARAEAVIAELIELGLDDRRLYAIGYGETLPVATNDTVAGKAQNRRIVFELVR